MTSDPPPTRPKASRPEGAREPEPLPVGYDWWKDYQRHQEERREAYRKTHPWRALWLSFKGGPLWVAPITQTGDDDGE